MVTLTTTIRQITTMSGALELESDIPDRGMYSFRAIYDAYIACRRRKRCTLNVLKFETDLLENLYGLIRDIANGSYSPSCSICFVTQTPKLREIFSADFRDRVVHHLIVPGLEKIFEPKFIYDSYACRKNKGTHAAVRRLRSFMNGAACNGQKQAWFLQLDIRSFFMSIDKEILLDILEKHIEDRSLVDLAGVIINHRNTDDYIIKGNPALLKKIPPHKTLFHAPANKGLPIGNLTSQFFANVYLNELDQYVKHILKTKYYIRYVDDLILVDTSKNLLLEKGEKIKSFLKERLSLELKPEQIIKKVTTGANFLGYIIRPDYTLCGTG